MASLSEKDYIVFVSKQNGEALEEIGVMASSEAEAIENAKSDLVVNLGYDVDEVESFQYEVELDSFQEAETVDILQWFEDYFGVNIEDGDAVSEIISRIESALDTHNTVIEFAKRIGEMI